jgi:hypothetical protein
MPDGLVESTLRGSIGHLFMAGWSDLAEGFHVSRRTAGLGITMPILEGCSWCRAGSTLLRGACRNYFVQEESVDIASCGEPGRLKLQDVLNSLQEIGDDRVIFVDDLPLITGSTSATLVPEDAEDDVPSGVRYLLEVTLAREVVEVWSNWRGGILPNVDQKCEAVIYYARNDTYLPAE